MGSSPEFSAMMIPAESLVAKVGPVEGESVQAEGRDMAAIKKNANMRLIVRSLDCQREGWPLHLASLE